MHRMWEGEGMKRLRVIRELTRCYDYCKRERDDVDPDENCSGEIYEYYQGQVDAFDKSIEVVEEAMALLKAIALCALGVFIIFMGVILCALSVLA